MGRPYSKELQELDRTYAWCLSVDISELARSIGFSASLPLITVGSGGSLTAAHFASLLHALFAGGTAQVSTPLEIATTKQRIADRSVLICSAGGSNPDVLAAARNTIKRAPKHLFALTTRAKSPLESLLKHADWPDCHSFSTPTRKDGFLATNSLLASVLLLTRAYEKWSGATSCLPASLINLLHPDDSRAAFLDRFRDETQSVLARETVIVLYGDWTKPAAMDVESRLTESGLAHVQPADYRNFAHGRHYWLARHAETTSVLAFAEKDGEIVDRTLAIIPPTVPRARIKVSADLAGAIRGICYSIFLVWITGEIKRADPGRPHVPQFGRKLYHLRAIPGPYPADVPERLASAIEKKARLPLEAIRTRPAAFEHWSAHYKSFLTRLGKAKLGAIVFDYDGTLCGPHRRLEGPSKETATRLNDLLAKGLSIGVATGRGKSVREDLTKIIRSKYYDRVLIGYHNGAEIAPLSDATCPSERRPLASELEALAACLMQKSSILQQAKVEAKGKQITLELVPAGDPVALLSEVSAAVDEGNYQGLSIVTSSHSIDILAPGVSKRMVVAALAKRLKLAGGGTSEILCIGDRGYFPGNDAGLLNWPLSLSVDEVSTAPETCWNVALPELRFESACLEYLSRVNVSKSGARFEVKGMFS